MKKTIVAAIALAAVSFSAAAQDWKHYNNSPNHPAVVELPSGAIGNVTAVTKIAPFMRLTEGLSHEQVTENVWFLGGHLYAPVVIELDEGLIVVPTGDDDHDGKMYRDYIRANISEKPIIAVLYDHNHYVKGTGVMLDGDDAILVAHPDLHGIVSARTGDSQANTDIPEMAPHLKARASIHYGALAAKKGPDAQLLPTGIRFDTESSYMEPTHTLEDGESIVIGGLEIRAFHHITDTHDNLTFYIPEYDLVIDNVVWPVINMYTLRGDAYRDPSTWLGALRDIRDLEP